MSYFIIWICFNLKIECVIDDTDNSIAINLLLRENKHIDVWKRIRLNQSHLKKLVKTIDLIENKSQK